MSSTATKITPFDPAVDEVKAKIEELRVTLTTLLRLQAEYNGVSSFAAATRDGAAEISHDTFFNMTISDAAKKYLAMMKATKSTAEIAEGLEQGGLKHSSKSFTTTVRSILGASEHFTRVPNGDWGLTEWYPGLGRGRKAKAEKQPKTQRTGLRPNEPKHSTLFEDQEPQQKPAKEGTAEDKILAAMRGNVLEEWTQPKLAAETGLKPSTVAGTVFRLRKEEKIKSREDGKGYVLA